MPHMVGGGVEKNLYIISNYLAKKIYNVYLVSSTKSFNKNFKNVKKTKIDTKFSRNIEKQQKPQKYLEMLKKNKNDTKIFRNVDKPKMTIYSNMLKTTKTRIISETVK